VISYDILVVCFPFSLTLALSQRERGQMGTDCTSFAGAGTYFTSVTVAWTGGTSVKVVWTYGIFATVAWTDCTSLEGVRTTDCASFRSEELSPLPLGEG